MNEDRENFKLHKGTLTPKTFKPHQLKEGVLYQDVETEEVVLVLSPSYVLLFWGYYILTPTKQLSGSYKRLPQSASVTITQE